MISLFEKLYKKDQASFFELLKTNVLKEQRLFLVTANPEVFSRAQENQELKKALLDDETMISPDGEGIVKATKMLNFQIWGKIAGVDTVRYLFEIGNQEAKTIYFYGSKQDVLDALKIKLQNDYPSLKVIGLKNGYDYKEEDVFLDIKEKKPDIVLVALGVPRQELVISHHFHEMEKGIFVGVGGSLDVLSGTKKRAPKVFIQCKLEWLYRLMKEPNRIKKFYQTHVLFIFKIRKIKKEG